MKKITFLLAVAFAAVTASAGTRTIYLDANIWNVDGPVFAAHVWNLGDEDAADYWLELVEGNIFKAEIRDDATSVIFLRIDPAQKDEGNVWAGEWNRAQAGIPEDKNQFRINSWDDPWGFWMNNGDPIAPAQDVLVRVQKPEAWAGLNIWAWDSSDAEFMAKFTAWPGVAMQSIGNGWFQFIVKDDAWFLVNNGDGSVQTQAAMVLEESCFTVGSTADGEGHFPLETFNCEDVHTDIMVIENAKTSSKVIRDGQLYIIRDGRMYNALGTETK